MPRGRGEDGSENQEGQVSFETLRDEGQHFVHVQQHHKAIESFTKALELNPSDKHCLVTRSKCYLQVGNAEASLADAESALTEDKELIMGLFQKAEALYQKGDFENALMFYHRGHRLRPERHEFRLGIQKSQEAINNSIGTPESVKLEANKGDMSYFYKQEEWRPIPTPEFNIRAKKQQRGGYSKPIAKKEEKKDRAAPKGPADDKTIKQLLGELYGDKAYLEKLLKDQSLTGKNNRNDMSREIKDKVCDGLEYLYSRADFWGQQKPMYARKREQRQRQGSSKGGSKNPMDKVLNNLEKIDDAQTDGRYGDSLDLAKNTLKVVESSSDEEVQNKPELTASLHSSIGNAYLEMGKLNQAEDHHHKDLEIAKENDLEDAKSRALDNLGRVYARKGDYEKAIEVWQEKIPSSKSALESTWLYHEIGRCYLELGKYSDARDYGEKSLAAAKEAEDDGWQLHACVLVAQSEVKLSDYQSAAESFEKALDLAKRQHDTAAESAITRALDEVNEKIVKGEKEGDEQEADGGENYEEDFDAEPEQEPEQEAQKSPPKSPVQTQVKSPVQSPAPSPARTPEPQQQEEQDVKPEDEQTTNDNKQEPAEVPPSRSNSQARVEGDQEQDDNTDNTGQKKDEDDDQQKKDKDDDKQKKDKDDDKQKKDKDEKGSPKSPRSPRSPRGEQQRH